MIKSTLLLMALFCFGPGYPQSNNTDLKKLDWLIGTWIRTNAKPGQSGNEHWIKVSPTELSGVGITMKGQDTLFVEKFKLVIKNNSIYYTADVPENKQPVDFKLTEISAVAFSCENYGHDFPKKIRYEKHGESIKATISGDGKSFDYLFEKSK